MNRAELRAVILDFDGVLVESEAVKAGIFAELFARYPDHTDAMMAYHRAHLSMPRRGKFEQLADRVGAGPVLVETLLDDFSHIAVERISTCAEVRGAADFLEEFAAQLPLFVASVTPEPDLREILRRRGWIGRFAGVFGEPPTRKADAVRTVQARLNVSPAQLLLVGDTPADYRVAQETRVCFVARDGGHWSGPADVPVVTDMLAAAAFIRAALSQS